MCQLVIAAYRLSFGVDGEEVVGVKALGDVEKPTSTVVASRPNCLFSMICDRKGEWSGRLATLSEVGV
jgi:hypothetical protein